MEANLIQIQTSHAFKGTLGREYIKEYIPHAAGAFVQRTTSKIAFNASRLFPKHAQVVHKLLLYYSALIAIRGHENYHQKPGLYPLFEA